MIVGHNKFPLVLSILRKRIAITSLKLHDFFCYNRAKQEENVAPESPPGQFLFPQPFSYFGSGLAI